jgi:hypothetical protein
MAFKLAVVRNALWHFLQAAGISRIGSRDLFSRDAGGSIDKEIGRMNTAISVIKP